MHRLAVLLVLVVGCGGAKRLGDGGPADGAESLDAVVAGDAATGDSEQDSCDHGSIRCGKLCCPAGSVCEASQCKPIDDCTVTPCTGLSYCDLATKKCNPGCITAEQCGADQVCDLVDHQCKCIPGYHNCSGVCVSDSSPASCGTSCTPCPGDPNGSATCSMGQCGIACNTGYHLCAGQCVSNTSIATCGTSCAPCPSVANGQGTCDGKQCGIACDPGFNDCGGQCVVNSVQSCGPSCTVCPTKPGTKPGCVANKCVSECLNGASLGPMLTLFEAPVANVLSADVTGDGHADVIATNSYAYKLLVYAGTGIGTFQAAKSYSLTTKPTSTVVGDFDGDNKLDVVVGHGKSAYILLSGAAALQKTALYEGSKLAAGDFDNDGKLDLATTAGGSWARVWLGDGAGGFTFKANVNMTSNVYAFGAADFNSDGRDDLVAAGSGGVHVALSSTDGTPGVPTATALTEEYVGRGLGTGDFNGDGKPDVVTSTTASLVLLIGNGNGAFQAPVTYAEDFSYGAGAFGVGDFNGDGKLDVAYPGDPGSTKSVRFRLGSGTGVLGAASSTVIGTGVPINPRVEDIAVADFNGDGLSDVAVEWGGARVLLAGCK